MIAELLFSFAAAVPSQHAFTGWQDTTEIETRRIETYAHVELACAAENLEPASADSNAKQYHLTLVGSYDHAKMTASDEACAIASQMSPKHFCLRPKLLNYMILSDLYKDACGNIYRGFWDVMFFDSDESMGTLFSKGRTLYEKPDSPHEFVPGPTYPVARKTFLFFAKP